MRPEVADEIARISENFAAACYLHGYGCAQSLVTYNVLLVSATGYSDLIPKVEKGHARANKSIENAAKAVSRKKRRGKAR